MTARAPVSESGYVPGFEEDIFISYGHIDNVAPSQGHAIDHLGWAVTNVDAKVGELASTGLKTEAPRGVRNLRVGFVYAAGGVRIEMVQGRTEEELVGH